MKREKSCGALVYRYEGDRLMLLLLRHRHGGHWSFPKGHVELGETEVQTAEREVQEETGLRVKVDDGFRAENAYMTRADTRKQVVYFIATADDQPLVAQRGEVREVRWEPVEKAPRRLTYAGDREILKNAYAYLLEHQQ